MSKEKLLDSFDKEFPYVISGKIIDNENGAILFHEKTNLIKLFLSQAIDKTREETIKEVVREVYKYLRECEKNRYENRITATEEIIELINNLKQ